jgi:hypothetical protein
MSFPNLFALNCAKFPHNCANAKEALEATREDSFFAPIAFGFYYFFLVVVVVVVVGNRSEAEKCGEGKIAKSEGEDTRRLFDDVEIFFLLIVSLSCLSMSLCPSI